MNHEYLCFTPVFKLLLQENVQNAEDAGATKIKFVLDERKFAGETVFSLSKERKPNLDQLQVGQRKINI